MARGIQNAEATAWKAAFGASVRSLREAKGWSQEALADEAEVHRTYVGAVERGEQNISLVLMHQLAEALDVSPAAFFTR